MQLRRGSVYCSLSAHNNSLVGCFPAAAITFGRVAEVVKCVAGPLLPRNDPWPVMLVVAAKAAAGSDLFLGGRGGGGMGGGE